MELGEKTREMHFVFQPIILPFLYQSISLQSFQTWWVLACFTNRNCWQLSWYYVATGCCCVVVFCCCFVVVVFSLIAVFEGPFFPLFLNTKPCVVCQFTCGNDCVVCGTFLCVCDAGMHAPGVVSTRAQMDSVERPRTCGSSISQINLISIILSQMGSRVCVCVCTIIIITL